MANGLEPSLSQLITLLLHGYHHHFWVVSLPDGARTWRNVGLIITDSGRSLVARGTHHPVLLDCRVVWRLGHAYLPFVGDVLTGLDGTYDSVRLRQRLLIFSDPHQVTGLRNYRMDLNFIFVTLSHRVVVFERIGVVGRLPHLLDLLEPLSLLFVDVHSISGDVVLVQGRLFWN